MSKPEDMKSVLQRAGIWLALAVVVALALAGEPDNDYVPTRRRRSSSMNAQAVAPAALQRPTPHAGAMAGATACSGGFRLRAATTLSLGGDSA